MALTHKYNATDDSDRKLARQEYRDKRAEIIDDVTAIIANAEAWIAAPVTTNAGRDAELLQDAKDKKQLAKDLKVLENMIRRML